MKTFLAFLLSAALCFAEQAPAVPVQAAPAESAAPESHAEVAESAAPDEAGSPSEPKPHAEVAKPQAPNPSRSGARGAQRPPCRAEVRLVDGSLLKGALRPRFLPAVSPSLGRVRVDLSEVVRIDFISTDPPAGSSAEGARSGRREGARGPAKPGRGATSPSRISFKNGDRLTATLSPKHDHFVLATLLGPLQIPLSAVRSISFNPSASRLQPRTSHLLYHCTFDSPESIAHPAAGPAGRFLGGEFVPGKKGRALLVKARTPAAEVPFPTGLMQPEGCIEFWAKIPGATKDTRYPDGGNPQFFAMGVGPWVNTFVKYTANDGFGTSGLHADLPGSAYVSSLPSWSGSARYPDFLGDPSAWHHYALVWSEKGLDAASKALGRRVVSALYVDGCLVNPAYGTNGPDRAKFLRQFSDLPVILHFPFFPGRQLPNQSQVDYLIDEFKIWSVPKFDAAGASVVPVRQYKPELIYHCTFDSAEAIERPAAGPSGTFLGGEFVPGQRGNALRVRKGLSSAIVHFQKGAIQPRGTIEFWAKIENDRETFSDGGDPRFFMIITPPASETLLQFSANDGCGRGGLSAYNQVMALASADHCLARPRYDSILAGSAKEWHHYALVWDSDGIAGTDEVAAVFLDGKRVSMHGDCGLNLAAPLAARYRDNPSTLCFSLNPEWNRGFNNKSDFLIDEFKIWSGAKTEFDLP